LSSRRSRSLGTMLAIRAYLLVDYQVNAEATPDSIPPAHGTRPGRPPMPPRLKFFPGKEAAGAGAVYR